MEIKYIIMNRKIIKNLIQLDYLRQFKRFIFFFIFNKMDINPLISNILTNIINEIYFTKKNVGRSITQKPIPIFKSILYKIKFNVSYFEVISSKDLIKFRESYSNEYRLWRGILYAFFFVQF